MRILFVHNRYRNAGGEDVALKLESELLVEKGHLVETLYFENEELSDFSNKWAMLKNAVSNPNSAAIISNMINRFKPDIIHVHNLFFVASPSILEVAEKSQVPVIMTLHNFRLVCCNALMLRKNKPCEICRKSAFPLAGIIHKCYRNSASASAFVTSVTSIHKLRRTWQTKVAKYIVLTNFAKKLMIGSSLNVPEEQMIVLPNFVRDSKDTVEDKNVGHSQPNQLSDTREDYFLFAGRLTLEKGIFPLVRAFRSMPDIKLLIAGEGPDKERLEYEISDSENIKLLGPINRDKLQVLMKKCKALLFPSIWYEGLPYVILESFCNGTPVIASKLGAMESIIQDGFNGLHFEADDEIDLCRAVRQFCKDGAALYSGARNSWESNYTPEHHYERLLKLYSEEISQFERKLLSKAKKKLLRGPNTSKSGI